MISDEKLAKIFSIAEKDEASFCLQIASDLTVRARSLYSLDGGEMAPFCRAFNELMHLTVNQSLNATRGSNRYQLKDFLRILVRTADKSGVGSAIEASLDIFLARSTRDR